MRVYNQPTSGGSWTSVEDYLPAGSALGYNQNWQYRYSGGELPMMTASGEPSAYYPMDSNGLAVQNAPAQPCIRAVVAPAQTAACSPLGYGGCEGKPCTTIADTANSSSWSDRSLWWSTLPMKGVELCSESGCGFLF